MAKSLSDSANFVDHAFYLLPDVAFKPENTVLGSYTFLPWVRAGIGAAVTNPPPGALRALVTIDVPVQADGAPDKVASQTLQVRGPGDVVGLDERQVIRRYPEPGATTAEETFLAHVELDRPELPWLFSPAAPAGDRLNPWLALVVLESAFADLEPGRGGLPPRVHTRKGELQPLDDAWAWAHAQVIPDKAGASIADRLSRHYASVNLSRLVCPRALGPKKSWLACVVPIYDAGVKTGLGASGDGSLGPAWTRAADGGDGGDEITLPVYTSWRFNTGLAGDFESLAKKLEGVVAPWQVGRRVMDTAKPGGGLPELGPADPGRLQTVRGPLVSLQNPNPASPDPDEVAAAGAETATWPVAETEALRTLLNKPDELAGKEGVLAAADRPLVGPEIYARYHAAVSRVEPARDADWFGELNLRPPNRVVGGLGTRVVQHDQEPLMQSAWAQVGAIDEANRQLRRAQLGRFVGTAIFARHVEPLAYGDALAMTRRAHSRVLADEALTVAAAVADSHVADSATTAAFRRVTRPLGALTRYAADHRPELARLVAVDGVPRDFQRPYHDLDGITAISEAAAAVLDPAVVADVMGVDPGSAVSALTGLSQEMSTLQSIPDALASGGLDGASPSGMPLNDIAGLQVIEVLEQAPIEDPQAEQVRAVAYLGLLASLMQIPGQAAVPARELANRLRERLDVGDVGPHLDLLHRLEAASNTDPFEAVSAMGPVAAELVSTDWPGTPVLPPLTLGSEKLLAGLHPATTVTARMKARIGELPDWLPPDWFDDLLVQPIMAAPVFTRPMYEALDDYSHEWLIPHLAALKQPDLVTVLLSNATFLEAFLAGLSHEMGRELLWRGYPTDQRGTYFRRFWNAHADELAQDLHRFKPTPLSNHVKPELKGRLVALVRGEVIRRYPDAMVLALRAHERDAKGHPVFFDLATNPETMAPILFHAPLKPDIVLVGFDLTPEQVKAADQDWWFIVAEHPTAPRFGFDEPPRTTKLTRDTVVSDDLHPRFGMFLDATIPVAVPDSETPGAKVVTFGHDAAGGAHVLLQSPVRAAFDAKKLLGPTGGLGA